jgi:hypothetical protein
MTKTSGGPTTVYENFDNTASDRKRTPAKGRTVFGEARLPHDPRILTKLLTLVSPNAVRGRCPCRAEGLPRR